MCPLASKTRAEQYVSVIFMVIPLVIGGSGHLFARVPEPTEDDVMRNYVAFPIAVPMESRIVDTF